MKKVLIAEDEYVSSHLMVTLLQDHFDICHAVVDGREAVDSFVHSLEINEPYHLICLDIMMPRLDGQSALKEIRKVEQLKGVGCNDMVKILMTSALDGAKDIMSAFMQGSCDGYLTKPISPAKLYEQLEKLGFEKLVKR